MQLKWRVGKSTESSSESCRTVLQDWAASWGRDSAPTPQPVNLPHCAQHITPLVSLTLPFHYFFLVYKSYFWSARHIFTEGIVNIRFIQLCVILNPLNSPGKKQDHSSEHFNKQAKTLYKKRRTDRKKGVTVQHLLSSLEKWGWGLHSCPHPGVFTDSVWFWIRAVGDKL